jgi:hypothetical protein
VDGRIKLEWILGKLCQDKDQGQALVITLMNIRFL